jgi:uncharacterized protein
VKGSRVKTTVIYHRADFDGIFCREIARRFLPEAELIGWDYGDEKAALPEGQVYILDLSPECVEAVELAEVVWIDHHKTAIEKWPAEIPGYRIDGVAACRLAWQWFSIQQHNAQNQTNEALLVPLPGKQDFIERTVCEPWAVRLAGEYDIWDKRDPDAETFQFGLRSTDLTEDHWRDLLSVDIEPTLQVQNSVVACGPLLENGRLLQRYQREVDAGVVLGRSFTQEFEGLRFLCLNTARCNSLTFAAGIKPEHDALLGFYWNGAEWRVSLYHAPGKEEHDLSRIAARHGGGGHRGACGFQVGKLPFIQNPAARRGKENNL